MIEIKKYIFTQSCGIFKNDVLVAVNCSFNDILKYAKKHGNQGFVEGIKKNKSEINELILRNDGFVILNNDLLFSGILYLKRYDVNWKSITTLLHELHHLVYLVADQKNFEGEMEAQAYLFESLFNQIRIRLSEELTRLKKLRKKN